MTFFQLNHRYYNYERRTEVKTGRVEGRASELRAGERERERDCLMNELRTVCLRWPALCQPIRTERDKEGNGAPKA